mmetsp:Transcript_4416/g.17722  ORF Transcript_4416/g.17722 Transcript_4416/m.17722 type:complete len:212 (-) Transcript_4416:202-837(-)
MHASHLRARDADRGCCVGGFRRDGCHLVRLPEHAAVGMGSSGHHGIRADGQHAQVAAAPQPQGWRLSAFGSAVLRRLLGVPLAPALPRQIRDGGSCDRRGLPRHPTHVAQMPARGLAGRRLRHAGLRRRRAARHVGELRAALRPRARQKRRPRLLRLRAGRVRAWPSSDVHRTGAHGRPRAARAAVPLPLGAGHRGGARFLPRGATRSCRA